MLPDSVVILFIWSSIKPSLFWCMNNGFKVFISSRAAAGSSSSNSSLTCGSTDLFLNCSYYLQKNTFHQASAEAVMIIGLPSVQEQTAASWILRLLSEMCIPVTTWEPTAFKHRVREWWGGAWSGVFWLTAKCTFCGPFNLCCTQNLPANLNPALSSFTLTVREGTRLDKFWSIHC